MLIEWGIGIIELQKNYKNESVDHYLTIVHANDLFWQNLNIEWDINVKKVFFIKMQPGVLHRSRWD